MYLKNMCVFSTKLRHSSFYLLSTYVLYSNAVVPIEHNHVKPRVTYANVQANPKLVSIKSWQPYHKTRVGRRKHASANVHSQYTVPQGICVKQLSRLMWLDFKTQRP